MIRTMNIKNARRAFTQFSEWSVLSLALMALVSCASQPEPAEAMAHLPPGIGETADTQVKVHFGTNRAGDSKYADRKAPPFFTSVNGKQITYGTIVTTIEPHNKVGKLDAVKLKDRPVILQEHKFFANLRDDLEANANASDRSLLIFVHGYNVTFEKAARRTAQLKHDLRFEGEAAFYSWPSRGKLLGYWADEGAVVEAEPFLQEFLIKMVRESSAKRI